MEEQYLPVFDSADEEGIQTPKPKKKAGAVQVALVQCICCAALILLFWLFKVCGGEAYTQLRTAFSNALQNNTLFATVAALFEERQPDETYTQTGTATAATTSTTVSTTGTVATAVTTAPTSPAATADG